MRINKGNLIPVQAPESGPSTALKMTMPSTTEEKILQKNDVKARNLEHIHDDDLEEMDLKWNMALLSMRARKFYQRTGRKIVIDGSSTAGKQKLESSKLLKSLRLKMASEKAMFAINGVDLIWSDMAEDKFKQTRHLMALLDSSLLTKAKGVFGKWLPLNTSSLILNIQQPIDCLNSGKGNKSDKPSTCWVRRPIKPNGASLSNSQLNEKGFVDSGCSRHMSGNIAHLSDFKEFDGGYVTFGGGANGGRITGKGTIKTNNLDFEDVYFVKELKFNLFSVSQMCDKKNYVLFTDSECLVLSPNFKMPDESQILLKIPRQNNMYSFDMKNIVPKDGLTCLVAKATSEESMLWHRRLGHVQKKFRVKPTIQQDQDCIIMPIWKDASYFEDTSLKSVADTQIQDQDMAHDDCSFQDDGFDENQVNTASPQVNTGSGVQLLPLVLTKLQPKCIKINCLCVSSIHFSLQSLSFLYL
ncbi:hypothetical protein Tco_1219917 [Tanacetum coccineum]